MYITQGLKRAVSINGAGVATIDGPRQHTWQEFGQQVAKLAGALKQLGLREDDRVAVLALNSDRYLAHFFATAWAGGIIVPLNTRLTSAELTYMLNDAGAKILVVDEALQQMLPDILPNTTTLKHIIFAGEGVAPADTLNHDEVLAAADPIPDTERGGDAVAGIFYTGGTTGTPKGVMLTHHNIISNALSSLAIMYEGEPWTYLHTAPMFHIADCQWNTGITIHGGTHVFAKRFVPAEMLQTISDYQITHCALVPTMINMLCQVPDVESYDVSSLKKVNFGGSPMPAAVITRAREVFPDCQFIQGYGQTETSPNISMLLDKYNTLEGPWAGKTESAGQPVFTMEVRVVDPQDEAVPPGTIGEIVTRGPHVMAGYWNKPAETAQALRGGWMHTGDAGYMDEDGFIFIVDRMRDMIISGAENIYSSEVENAIYQHAAVAMCAVIGIPDEKWGETVHAVIVPKADQTLTEAEIDAHCHLHLAGFKCPRSFDIRPEPLPTSGAGKILKTALRAPFWAGKSRQIN